MYFNSLGEILYKNKVIDSGTIRKNINRMKTYILDELNPNGIVAVAVVRNEYLIYIIFALIECNITFLPIDIKLPKERIKYMLENAGVESIIISDKNNGGMFGKYKYILETDVFDTTKYDRVFINSLEYDRPVYILYTSGSTGRPKAVTITYKGFTNFLEAIPGVIKFEEGKKIACFTTFSFDIFFLEAVLGLVSGMMVVLADEEEQNNPKSMIKLISENKVNMLQMTPSRMELLVMYADVELSFMKSVNVLMLGGEKLSDDFLQLLKSKISAKIYNMYGPTETTIWSTVSDLSNKCKVDIGKPIKNTSIYIVNENKEQVGTNKEGEILIGGAGLALGYYNQPKLTEERFIIPSFAPNERVYCTGDIGRYDEEGNLFYIGRKDSQIKIRGYRIELEEIEKIVKNIDGIISALACVSDNNIVCFYTGKSELAEIWIKDYLSLYLPDYMIPVRFFKTDKYIYTVSGKVDRKSMADSISNMLSNIECIDATCKEKQDFVEISVIKTFNEVLKADNITRETSLKSLGIHSFNYIQIVVELEEKFNIEFEEDYLNLNVFSSVEEIIAFIKNKF